jgi:hypothetical protein
VSQRLVSPLASLVGVTLYVTVLLCMLRGLPVIVAGRARIQRSGATGTSKVELVGPSSLQT